mgnify:CR=1 FL=1
MRMRNLLPMIGFMLISTVSHAALTLISIVEDNLSLAIPDYQSSGLARTVTISGYESQVPYIVTASIKISPVGYGAYNGDYYAYLRHITTDGLQSQVAVLLNRPGRTPSNTSGYENSGMDVTFADDATFDIHLYQPNAGPGDLVGNYLTGTWQPDARKTDPFGAVASDPRTAFLNPLGTMDPNGQWTLFIADMERGGTGSLQSWGVKLTPTPEPASASLVLVALGVMLLNRRRRR